MRIDVRSDLRALSPATLQEQLRSWGFHPRGGDGRVAVYVRGADELDVPLRPDFADYPRRVEELIGILAALEGVPLTDLLDSLLQPQGDIITLRVGSPVTEAGTILLEDAIRMREGLKTMVLAAAHSALSPEPWFARMTQRDPVNLLANVRESQSQRGSFSMCCIVPVSPPVGPLDTEEPYGRKVTRVLVGALESIQEVRSRGDREGLLHLADRGVGGNLLAALGTMTPPGGTGVLEVSVSWARSRPAPGEGTPRVRLPAPVFDGLADAAAAMRDRVKARGFEVIGYVTRLERSSAPQDGGDVTLAPTEEDARDMGSVAVPLGPEAYVEAIEAHRQGMKVRVLGTLEKKGRRWTLSEPTGFERWPDANAD